MFFNCEHQTKTKMFHTYFQKQTNEVYDVFLWLELKL